MSQGQILYLRYILDSFKTSLTYPLLKSLSRLNLKIQYIYIYESNKKTFQDGTSEPLEVKCFCL